MISTVRPAEIARFDGWAATWWNPAGPMRPLHVVNALRVDLVLDLVAEAFGRARGDLGGLRVADIGCGAGLMCEPLAERGARVVGLDAAARNVEAAHAHAAARGLAIDYRHGEPASALAAGERFDLMLLLEVVEHVDDVAGFLARAAAHLAPGGLLVVSTINRTWRSWVVAIVGAEWLFRVLPVGTHRWRQFVRPDELDASARTLGLAPGRRLGMRYWPLVHRAHWTRDLSVNFLLSYRSPAANAERAKPA